MCVCVYHWACGDLPDSSEDAVQIFLHLHKRAGVEQEALVHLLQPDIRQPVEVDQHFVGFLKAVKPVFTIIQTKATISCNSLQGMNAGVNNTVTRRS